MLLLVAANPIAASKITRTAPCYYRNANTHNFVYQLIQHTKDSRPRPRKPATGISIRSFVLPSHEENNRELLPRTFACVDGNNNTVMPNPKKDALGAVQICRELYPALFERFEDALGSKAILEMLDRADLDEAKCRQRLEAKLKLEELTLMIPALSAGSAARSAADENDTRATASVRDRFRDRPWLRRRGAPKQPMSPLKYSCKTLNSLRDGRKPSDEHKKAEGKGWVSGRRRTVG